MIKASVDWHRYAHLVAVNRGHGLIRAKAQTSGGRLKPNSRYQAVLQTTKDFMYKLIMLQTPDVSGLSELETEVTRLVNDAVAQNSDWDLSTVELIPLVKADQPVAKIYNIALHFIGKE